MLFLQGATLGLSDDEAYYWVLAQRPAWAYAFHPPAMAWFVRATQICLGWLLGSHSAALVRFPAALSMAIISGLAMYWLERVGVLTANLWRSFLVLVSFAGFSALCWMLVPDTPLFLGWMILMVATWEICAGGTSRFPRLSALTVGTMLILLSKYSGIIGVFSCFLAVSWLAPKSAKPKAILCLITGTLLASIPVLIWNYHHEWASILYQIQSRHEGASLSFKRYFRFWLIEIVAAGPVVFYGFTLLRNFRESRLHQFLTIWILPPLLIFGLQPLWSDFKPHWAFIVWWPMILGLAVEAGRGEKRWTRFQLAYGLPLAFVVLFACHFPLLPWATAQWGKKLEPKLDVTNDFYAWADFPEFLRSLGPRAQGLPILGSRYQTAAQAAASLGDSETTTLIPRDIKARDEWPVTAATESQGPDWPALKAPVLFVKDNRYDARPEFKGSQCEVLGRFEKNRGAYLAKWIEVERCDPQP